MRRSMVYRPLIQENVEAAARLLTFAWPVKAAKRNALSGVDMAKLKFAFQSEYYKTHRRQLRDYVFGYFHLAAGLASSVAPISNAMMEIPVRQKSFANILGITDQRPFPKFSNRTSVCRQRATEQAGNEKKIIFLSDPFSRYIEPETEQAAFDILSNVWIRCSCASDPRRGCFVSLEGIYRRSAPSCGQKYLIY